ncbi:hypothetical protein [Dysosmobacter sp.]|uniref:hypothetical protein n=1 Tax=Dysosmobacter sp. TaxID=2591382 RepID=UPI003A921183
MWFRILAISCAVILLSYWIGLSVLSEVLEDHGFYPGTDGRWHHEDDAADEEPTFTYCLNESVCEAFRVGDTAIPTWATNTKELDVILSTPPRVVLHKVDGSTATAHEGDYVVLFMKNTAGIVTAKEMEEYFVKIQLQEENV